MIADLTARVLRIAAMLTPSDRRVWAQAMHAEAGCIENAREALGFSLGCLKTALGLRFEDVLRRYGELVLGLGLAGFGGFVLQVSRRSAAAYAGSLDGAALAGLGATYLAAGAVCVMLGARGLERFAGWVGVLAALVLAVLLAAGAERGLLFGLASEAVIIWGGIWFAARGLDRLSLAR